MNSTDFEHLNHMNSIFEYACRKRPYSWSYAPTDRAACKGQCKQKICKGGLRFGYTNVGDFNDLQGTQFRCLDCVTSIQIKNILRGSGAGRANETVDGLDKVDGFGDLTPEDQARIMSKQHGGVVAQQVSQAKAKVKVKAKSKSKGAFKSRPRIGDRVRIVKENDPGTGLIARLDRHRFGTKGLIGEVVKDVGAKDILTFKVKFDNVGTQWYKEAWVETTALPTSQMRVSWLKRNSKPLDSSTPADSVYLAWYGSSCLLGDEGCGEDVTSIVKELLREGKPVIATPEVFPNLSEYDRYGDAALFVEIDYTFTTEQSGMKRKAIEEQALEDAPCAKRILTPRGQLHKAAGA